AISFDPAKYPEDYEYNEEKFEVRVGDGIIGAVAPEIWEFEVSGLKVVQSWLGYRMKKRAGKKSSPLDNIRPERWTPRMTEEFLELLWVLEATPAMEPPLFAVLDKVVGGECFKESELPTPTPEERKAPIVLSAAGDLIELMEDDTETGDEDE
ncbi:MAG: type ISP restriction/modification enzyme, partial [Rhodoplanes sp.]